MEQITPPTKQEIQDMFKIGLLENNELISQKIEKSGDKITAAVNAKTDGFISKMTDLFEKQGAVETRIDNIESKVQNLWAKVAAIGAMCTALGGLVGFLIAQLAGK